MVHTEYERVRELERRGLFDFEIICPTPLPTAAVVVIDPFSSGSILAARVLHYKLRLVMVFSEVRRICARLAFTSETGDGKLFFFFFPLRLHLGNVLFWVYIL